MSSFSTKHKQLLLIPLVIMLMFVPSVAGVPVNANTGSTAKGTGSAIVTVAGISAVANGVRGNNAANIDEKKMWNDLCRLSGDLVGAAQADWQQR